MNNIQLLDCTLRDGSYIVDSLWGNKTLKGIIDKLCKSKIDIIEVGFLKDVDYYEGSSTFNNLQQIKKYLPKQKEQTSFAVMIDYGRYTIEKLPPYNGQTIDIIRNCFFKKDRFEAVKFSKFIKKQGYKLYVQPVDILGYTDYELLDLIKITNELNPEAFSIVDTFGSMYEDDLVRIFSILHHNLSKNIKIGFHSHNNLQLSFALSQKIIELSSLGRHIVVDTTLCGMGRGAGNTNTELVVNYLNKKYNYGYDINEIMDLIDIYISPLAKEYVWGYSIPYFIAGMYSTHVHNIRYLLDKHKVCSKDMQLIISSLDNNIKKRYDYNNLEDTYISYFKNEIDDKKTIQKLKEIFNNKNILILIPGQSLKKNLQKIINFKNQKENIITISVNFVSSEIKSDILFFSNSMRFEYAKEKYYEIVKETKKIITSNIKNISRDFIVNYNNLINRKYKHFDNATILLLNLLNKIGCKNIFLAGFDGYSTDSVNSYIDKSLQTFMTNEEKLELNKEISNMLDEITTAERSSLNIKFLTKSIFNNYNSLNDV